MRSVFIVDAIPLQHQRRLYPPISSPWIWASEVCHGGLDAFFHWPLCGPHVKLTSTTCFPKTCCRRHHWGSVRFFVMNRKTSDMLRHQSAAGNQKRLVCLQAQPRSFALHPFRPPRLHSCIRCAPTQFCAMPLAVYTSCPRIPLCSPLCSENETQENKTSMNRVHSHWYLHLLLGGIRMLTPLRVAEHLVALCFIKSTKNLARN